MLTPERRNHFSAFPFHANWPTRLLLTLLFLAGFWISWRMRLVGMAVYLLLWLASYGVIYTGTCRYCVYYGKPCPIPLEGSCVHHLFNRGGGRFGFTSLIWAVFAYALRAFLPVFIVVREGLVAVGLGYAGVLALFWIVHLFVSGCPNCINTRCPLNCDYTKTATRGRRFS